MRKEDLKNWTREQMKSEILRLHRKLELFGIKFEENPNNFSFSHHGNRYYAGKLVNDYVALKEENTELKERVKEQREKIDSLLKELEEEKGKTITVGDGTISMRADMWNAVNEIRKLKLENNELRKRLGKLESDICGTSPCIVSEFHLFEGESWIKASTYDDVLLRLKNANKRITDLEQDMFNKSTDELKQVEKLSSENKSLKQQNDYLKNIFETAYIPESAESMMRKAGFSDEVIDDAKGRIEKLEKELKAENKSLKQRIKDLEDVCDGSCFSDETDDRDEKIAKMQDRIDSDCVRINRLKVTINTLVDMYGLLRNQVGMD